MLNGKTYCEVCGKEIITKAYHINGKTVCGKHYKQFCTYGKFLDSSPRTMYDMNEIIVEGNVAYVEMYDANGRPIAYAIIDAEDVPKIENVKWHLSGGGYAINSARGHNVYHMHRFILGVDMTVDHINQNKLDNRKCNLRIVTKSQNQMNNVNFKGYGQRPDGRFNAYIKLNQIAANLGIYVIEAEAAYARWYAERIVFKDFAPNKVEPIIPELRKMEIQAHVLNCIEKLFMKIGNYPFVRCNSLQEAMDCRF